MTQNSYELPVVVENNGVEMKTRETKANSIEDPEKVNVDGSENKKLEADIVLAPDSFSDDDYEDYNQNRCGRVVKKVEDAFHAFCTKNDKTICTTTKLVLLLLYLSFFAYCVQYRYFDEGSYILTVITGFIVLKIVSDRISATRSISCFRKFLTWYGTSPRAKKCRLFIRYALYLVSTVLVGIFLGVDVLMGSPGNSKAIIGLVIMVLLCFVFSYRPSRINWHPVFWGFVMQFAFAALTLRTEIGYNIFKWIGDLVHGFVRLSDKGSAFVFGDSFRADAPGFFFSTCGVIVFFNACIFMLEYFGILEFVVLKLGRGLSFCLETGPVESVVAAANIFIGLSEAPLLVRPFLPTVTKSELHAIMTCGFSSISGAFMAMFIRAGAPASHLLTAAIISAPAALAISKLLYPEIERVDFQSQKNIKMKDDEAQVNALQACSDGAAFSIKLVASIMVNMMAFVSLLNLVDFLLVWTGERMGVEDMTFSFVSSYILYPLAYVMGAETADCRKVGSLLGVKLFATPFVAYADLGKIIQNRLDLEDYIANGNGTWHWSGEDVILDATNTTLFNGVMAERSEVVTTYALCGISAFPAIGFSLGTLIPMSPKRKPDVVILVIRAFIAGNLANFVTGAVAGLMFTGA